MVVVEAIVMLVVIPMCLCGVIMNRRKLSRLYSDRESIGKDIERGIVVVCIVFIFISVTLFIKSAI